MVTFWAETPAGRVIQLVGLVFVMLAIAEYANVIDFLPLNSYVIVIGVIVLLRWFIQTYHKRERENVQR